MNRSFSSDLSIPGGANPQLIVGQDTISVKEWLNDLSITKGSRDNRAIMIRHLTRANGFDSTDQLFHAIQSDKLTAYTACKRMVDSLRKTHSPSTIYQQRSMLPGLFESVLGESNFSKRVFDRLAPCGDSYVRSTKKVPSVEQLRSMLKMANPLYRALVGILAVSGMRIGEALSRKHSDIEIRPEGFARVRLQSGETKARTARYCFITKECVEWVKIYTAWHGLKTDFLFPGEKDCLRYSTALEQIKILFRKNGMVDNNTEIYSPHSFRTFADSQMRKAGLDAKWVGLIIGHVSQLGAETSYKDWQIIEEEWYGLCESKLTWLEGHTLKIDQLERKTNDLQATLAALLQNPGQLERLRRFLSESSRS